MINTNEKCGFYILVLENIINIIDFYSSHNQLDQIYISSNEGMDYLDDIRQQFFDKNSIVKYKRAYDHYYRTFHTSMERAKNMSNFRRRVTRFSYLPYRGLKTGVVLKSNPEKGFSNIFEECQILLYHVGVEEDTHGLVLNKEFFFDGSWQLMGGPCDPEKIFLLHNIKGVPGAKEVSKGLYLGGSVVEYLLLMWDVYLKVQKKAECKVDWDGENKNESILKEEKNQEKKKDLLGNNMRLLSDNEDDVQSHKDEENNHKKQEDSTFMIPSINQLESDTCQNFNQFKEFLSNVSVSDFLQFKSHSNPSSSSLINISKENLEAHSSKLLKTLTSKVLKRLEDHTTISEYRAEDYIEDLKLKFYFMQRIRDIQIKREQKKNLGLSSVGDFGLDQSIQEAAIRNEFGSFLNQIYRSAIQRNFAVSTANLMGR
jgi:hypothetical protein